MEKNSVTRWIGGVKTGDDDSASRLWERYFQRLAGLARKRLQDLPQLHFDGEDVALSAFHSLCQGLEQGRFADLNDRDGLWRLLVTITSRKAQRHVRDELRQKRGGGRDRTDQGNASVAPLDLVPDDEPTPACVAEIADECRRLLAALDDDDLRAIALAKMDGMTVDEIAAKRGKTPRTIERKLRLIRDIWSQHGGPPS